jgi:hypothetical protein
VSFRAVPLGERADGVRGVARVAAEGGGAGVQYGHERGHVLGTCLAVAYAQQAGGVGGREIHGMSFGSAEYG